MRGPLWSGACQHSRCTITICEANLQQYWSGRKCGRSIALLGTQQACTHVFASHQQISTWKRETCPYAWMHVRIRECRHQAGPYQSQWGCTRNLWPLVLSGAYSWRITRYACIMEVWGSSQDFVRARRVLLLCSLESPLSLVVGWLPHISFLILGFTSWSAL